MNDLRHVYFNSAQLSACLGQTRAEFHSVRNSSEPTYKIKSTEGDGSRDQLWNALDAIKLWVISRLRGLGMCSEPSHRRSMFDAIADEDLLAAANHAERWVVADPFELTIVEDLGSLWGPEEWSREARLDGPAAVLPLHFMLPAFLRELAGAQYPDVAE